MVHTKLYDLLRVSPDASSAEIRKSYRLIALKVHPDKNPDVPDADENFKKLKEAYDILIDDEKRKLYDQQGITDDNFEEAWVFYQSHYPRVSEEDILKISAEYKGSEEEKNDLIKLYNIREGDISTLLEEIMLSQTDEIDRFDKIYQKLINEKTIKNHKNYTKSLEKLKKKAKKLHKEFEKEHKNKGEDGGLESLALAIRQKAQSRGGDLLDHLAEKYGNKDKHVRELTDEEFNNAQKKKKKPKICKSK
eukprot:GHVL01020645.1.p2 GENE.GHVL01020645.1~~GHVL01020645.1.p2  ORF type:complete len:249 (-),score=64.43 GHVL01020645.1:162-908(-)